MDGFIADRISLENEILKLTDWFTDDLFYSADEIIVTAGFSRIFCDVERFADDSLEIMAQYGMGVLYEKNDDGEVIRRVTPELKKRILNDFYWNHHRKLSEAVNKQLNQFGKSVIIDCHSFSNNPLKRDLDKTPERPDFNIGSDTFHTPNHLLEISKVFFKNAGFSLGINRPYSGSIVPAEHYHKNKNVQSIMLEINRALYMKVTTTEKSDKYSEIKKIAGDFIKTIKNSM